MTTTLRPIRTCAWNVGGGWLAGAEANLPHVLDALSHGGPMANIDILILTEAKLLEGHPTEEIDAAFKAACLDYLALPYTRTWWRWMFFR